MQKGTGAELPSRKEDCGMRRCCWAIGVNNACARDIDKMISQFSVRRKAVIRSLRQF